MSLYLRLSVTDRCNFFCRYCRPEKRAVDRPAKPLTDAEILELVSRIHGQRPLRKVRVTGGEPLVRPGLPALVEALRALLPDAELCLTTNGYRLAELAEPLKGAGLDRLNVSLDSLSPARFVRLTGVDGLDRVKAGIRSARRVGFDPLKLNAVLMRSVSGRELVDMLRFAAAHRAELRFIELMPMGVARRIYDQEYLPAAEALGVLQQELTYLGPADPSSTAQRHRFQVGRREVVLGLITPVSEPFCAHCDRIRLDSRGQLLGCLRRTEGSSLVEALRQDRPEQLAQAIEEVVGGKSIPEASWPRSQMALIGG
ncbi:MAG: GTP 3',8-cyclase MoaA [bacterium]